VLRTGDDCLIESVILRTGTGRVAFCISSQVGCAAACHFCGSGRMGLARNLSYEEILDQLVHAGELARREGRRVRNVVFMGMGEPFHNEEQLYAAIDGLLAAELFHHPPNRVLISTVGIPDAMIRCAGRHPQVQLALSLHAVRPAVRESMIPLAARYPLDEIRAAVLDVNAIQGRPLMIEYLLLRGLNDSEEDAAALIQYLEGLCVHVNLIPYNAIEGVPHLSATGRSAREAFAAVLRAAGLPTTIRYSLGGDIAAACGQLVHA
jgi:23S rRNA (adenine2503-C2)-methyltransferase